MKSLTTFLLAVFALVSLSGCQPDADTPLGVRIPVADSPRIKITRVGVIEDDLAYQRRRGLYVIEDTLTGKTFIGVSGVGITEVGLHKSGKTSAGDER